MCNWLRTTLFSYHQVLLSTHIYPHLPLKNFPLDLDMGPPFGDLDLIGSFSGLAPCSLLIRQGIFPPVAWALHAIESTWECEDSYKDGQSCLPGSPQWLFCRWLLARRPRIELGCLGWCVHMRVCEAPHSAKWSWDWEEKEGVGYTMRGLYLYSCHTFSKVGGRNLATYHLQPAKVITGDPTPLNVLVSITGCWYLG